MSFSHVFEHTLVGVSHLFGCENVGKYSHSGASVIVYLVFVEVGRERRFVEVDVRNEFLIARIPQVATNVLLELVAFLAPEFSLFRILGEFNEIIKGNHQHGVVINVNCEVTVLVDFNAPRVFGLHIAPVGGGSTDNQSV